MAKPIFLIKMNVDLTIERAKHIEEQVSNKLNNEYHVLIVANLSPGSEAQFLCLNAGALPESTIEEIKEALK